MTDASQQNDNILDSLLELSNSITKDDYKELYVGDGKKYSSEAEASKGLHNANEHIVKLEQENKDIKERFEKAEQEKNAKLDAILKRFESGDKLAEQVKLRIPGEKTSPSNDFSQEGIRQLIADQLKLEREAETARLKAEQELNQRREIQTRVLKSLEDTYGTSEAGLRALKEAANKIKEDSVTAQVKFIEMLIPKESLKDNNSGMQKPKYNR